MKISEKKAFDLLGESCGKDKVIKQQESKILEVLELKDRLELDLEPTSKKLKQWQNEILQMSYTFLEASNSAKDSINRDLQETLKNTESQKLALDTLIKEKHQKLASKNHELEEKCQEIFDVQEKFTETEDLLETKRNGLKHGQLENEGLKS